jgi:hypothetical protein
MRTHIRAAAAAAEAAASSFILVTVILGNSAMVLQDVVGSRYA